MQEHDRAVREIATRVKTFYEQKKPFRISHGSSNSTRVSAVHRGDVVDISGLSRVLSVDARARTALVEPNVPMDRLIEATLRHGLVPPVVMEFPGITAGGGFAGTGGESSSFKHGYFNETANWAEIVLGSGDVVRAAPDNEHAELFHAASGAVGSLGVTTLLELRLLPARRYVRTTYTPCASVREAVDAIERAAADRDAHDYVDGIVFSPTHAAVVTGSMTDELPPGSSVTRFSAPADPWFYLHVWDATRGRTGPATFHVPLAEYLFRYDRAGFWVGAQAFRYFRFPFTALARRVFDDFFHTRMLYRALHASGQARRFVVQDLALPFDAAEEFVGYAMAEFDIWPLWLCPLRQPRLPSLHPHLRPRKGSEEAERRSPGMLLNVGLWGWGPKRAESFIAKNVQLERRLEELGGMKWLYAQAYYSEDEFWGMFDRGWYESLRRRYCAEQLPSVWDKVAVDPVEEARRARESWWAWLMGVWPVAGVYGLARAIQSGDYKVARRKEWRTLEWAGVGEADGSA